MPEDVTKALDRAEAMVYDVNQRRVTDSTSKIEDLLGLNLDRLEQLYGRGDAITGVPTGYVDLDELLSGLQPSNLVVVGARPSMGKCVAWDTPIVDPATGELHTAADLHRAGVAGRRVSVLALTGGGRAAPASNPRRSSTTATSPSIACAPARGARSAPPPATRSSRPAGWRPLADLAAGQRVGVPAAIPVFGHDAMPIDEVLMLAHMVVAPGSDELGPRLWTDNREVATDIEHRGAGFGVRVIDRHASGRRPHVGRGAGRRPRRPCPAPRRRRPIGRSPGAPGGVPAARATSWHGSSTGHWGRSAAVWRPAGDEPGRVVATLRSLGLAHDLQHLLLRFGVSASRAPVGGRGRRRHLGGP